MKADLKSRLQKISRNVGRKIDNTPPSPPVGYRPPPTLYTPWRWSRGSRIAIGFLVILLYLVSFLVIEEVLRQYDFHGLASTIFCCAYLPLILIRAVVFGF